MLNGETAFTLYDTYGFPLDLTQDALRPRGIGVDLDALQRRDGAQRAEGARLVVRLRRGRDRDGLVSAPREARRDRVPRLRDRDRRGRRRRRSSATARRSTELKAGETGAVDRQPDAVLRRVRRPGRRHRRDDAPTACAFEVTDTQKKAGDLFVHHGTVEQGALKVGQALALEVDHARRAAIRAQPFGDPSAARGAAPGARRPRRAEGLAGRARPAALRLLASEADDAPRRSSASRTSPTTTCCRIRR